ncbi:MAG TPA: O-antigen ligase family protein, partial [Pirellulales bacterium]|nr:O-antigen ligase family protein [Pirellulales bacterium]
MSSGAIRARRRKASREADASESTIRKLLEPLPAWLAQSVLVALLVLAPWFLGGVQPWFHVVGQGALWFCIACWTCTLLVQRRNNELLPLLIAPLVAALLIPAAQLLPLDRSTRTQLNPAGEALRARLMPSNELASDSPNNAEASIAPQALTSKPALDTALPTTLYAAATRQRAALLLMGIEGFALGARFFRRQQALLVLLAIMAINGAAIAFFGLVQKLSWNNLLFWRIPLVFGGSPFGPFVNRNNAAGYLNLSLACALGLTVWAFARSTRQTVVIEELLSPPRLSLRERLAQWLWGIRDAIASLNALNLSCVILLSCIGGAVFASMSRGGMVALGGAAIVTGVATLAAGRRLHLGAIAIVLALAIGLVGWIGLSGQLKQRVGTLLETPTLASDGRLELLKICGALAGEYWRTGSGLGTFRWVQQPKVEYFRSSYFEYAENQYLETAVEAGLGGLLLLALVCGLQAHVVWRLLRADVMRSSELPWAVAGLFALGSQAIHSVSDFGLYLPANFLLFGVLCGALAGRAAMLATADGTMKRSFGLVLPGAALCTPALLVLLMAVGIAAWHETRTLAAVVRAMPVENTNDGMRTMPRVEAERQVADLTAAVRDRWDDAVAHARLAELWIRRFRYAAGDQLREAEVPDEQIWPLTDLGTLRARAIGLENNDKADELAQLRVEPTVLECLLPARQHLLASRDACPLLADVHLRLAELQFLVGNPLDDAEELDRAAFLAPKSPDILYIIGTLDLDADRVAQACRVFRNVWELFAAGYETRIMTTTLPRLPFREIISDIIPPS